MLRRARSILFITLLTPPAALSAQVRNVRKVPASDTAPVVTREQDGLVGPVRRVRTETAKLSPKAGALTEGPRKLQSLALYDRAGRRIDGENYLTDDAAPPGKEERYKYDDRGNIVEMRVLDADGSLLSQEVYAYEFDAVGNWTVMKTSVAVVEGGQLAYEPTEVTYRTITYYLTDAVARGVQPAKPKPDATAEVRRDGPAPEARAAATPETKAADDARTSPAGARDAHAPVKEGLARTPAREARATSGDDGTPAAPRDAGGAGPEAARVGAEAGASPPLTVVKEVSGDALRRAATLLPEPEYPQGAALAGVEGSVDVQVIVNERGEVTSTRTLAGDPLLAGAAEEAARRATFSPSRLTDEPAVIFGVLRFNFVRPARSNVITLPTEPLSAEARSAKTESARPSSPAPPPRAADGKVSATEKSGEKAPEPAASAPPSVTPAATSAAGPPPAATSAARAGAGEELKQGKALLDAGRYKDAIKALKTAARLHPEDYEVNYRLGEAYWGAQFYGEAIGALEKAVRLRPESSEAHYYLGSSYYGRGRYREAIRAFQQAIRLQPGVAAFHFGLGFAHLAAQEAGAARRQAKLLGQTNAALAAQLANAIRAFETYGTVNTGGIAERLQR